MSLGKRLERLEARYAPSGAVYGRGMSERGWERFFHAHENARREAHGLELLPELPYTKEDYGDDLKWLDEGIPAYRRSTGWQTEEARAVLDGWEREVREKLDDYRKDGA